MIKKVSGKSVKTAKNKKDALVQIRNMEKILKAKLFHHAISMMVVFVQQY